MSPLAPRGALEWDVGPALEGTKLAEEIELEIEATRRGADRYRRLAREAIERGDGGSLKPAERLIIHWFTPLRAAVREEQRHIAAGRPGVGRAIYGPIMLSLGADRLAVIVMHEMLSRCMAEINGQLLVKAAYGVGNAVIAEIHHDEMRKDHSESVEILERRFKRMTVGRVNAWAKKTLDDPKWSRRVCAQIGTRLIQLLIGVATVKGYQDEWTPCFEHKKQWRDGQLKGVVRFTDAGAKVIEDGHLYRQHLRPRFMPMVVEPCPWSDESMGGYIKLKPPLVSKPRAEQMSLIKSSTSMSLVYEAVNNINSTEWTVNTRVLDVMRRIWEDGGGVGCLPLSDLRPMPEKPADINTNAEALKRWKAEAHDVHGENARLRGARAEFIQKIELADRLKTSNWYLPHQLCFRARLYPIPPVLNHHGDDVSRGLMLFARRRELNERGRFWLKVHAANMFGFDKGDFEGRVSFIENQMGKVRAIANDPFAQVDDWAAADDPFQFLAACFALVDDDIGERLPVQRDGCQNGIQHYAAAGRDAAAAELVNIIPGPTPQDAYLEVGGNLLERITADAKSGNALAASVIKHCERPVYKQTVMTTVYNLTRVGARSQIKDKLKKRGVPKEELYPASNYLSQQVLASVGDTFKSAGEIMQWLETSARLMVKHEPTRAVQWTTPYGFPVVQPYRRTNTFQIRTCLQRLSIGVADMNAPVSLAKQVQGAPPNIVHSWDGCHAQGTAIECADEDVEFASVHDSFWTHAATTDELDVILRRQFIGLHGMDLVERLHEEWSKAYPGLVIPDPPAQGTLDLGVVMDSPYFFN